MALPPHAPDRLPFGLCVFGLTYACGLTWAGTPRANPKPLDIRALLAVTEAGGLSHLEVPLRLLGDRPDLRALRQAADEQGLRFVVAGGILLAGGLGRDLAAAAELGARVVRFTLSNVLCGDRRGFPGGWSAHLAACEKALEEWVPEAERCGIALAVENHQDADSEDLLRLCRRFESCFLGVTLDTGNPLAVMEDPVAFASRLAPYLRHAHLKDYTLHAAPNGCRLVRAPLGEGVVDFPALLALLDAQEWPITRSLEMAALQARLIPFLERGWWDEYPARDARDVLPALEVMWSRLQPADAEWRTPFEREADPDALLAYEWDHHARSLAYLRRLTGRAS
jgi:sugar phosphate isomerase/epimerase